MKMQLYCNNNQLSAGMNRKVSFLNGKYIIMQKYQAAVVDSKSSLSRPLHSLPTDILVPMLNSDHAVTIGGNCKLAQSH